MIFLHMRMLLCRASLIINIPAKQIATNMGEILNSKNF